MTSYTLLDLALRITAVVLIAGLVSTGLQRWLSASERHFLWMLGLGTALLMPMATRTMPEWGVLPARQHSIAIAPQDMVAPPLRRAPSRDAALSGGAAPVAWSPARRIPGLDLDLTLAGIWMLGSLVQLVRLLRGHQLARAVLRGARPAMRSAQAGVLQVWVSDAVRSPFSYGVQRPVVVIPAAAEGWPRQHLEAALLHETAHLARKDGIALLLAQLAIVLYWWHPAVHLAARQAAAERERACDDAVLRTGVKPSEYGALLLAHAILPGSQPVSQLAVSSFCHSGEVAKRIASLLDASVSRREMGIHHIAAASVLGIAGTALLASVSMASAPAPNPGAGKPELGASAMTHAIAPGELDQDTTIAPGRSPVPVLARSVCEQADPRVARTATFDSGVRITGTGSISSPALGQQLVWTGTDCIAWITVHGTVQPTTDGRSVMVGETGSFAAFEERAGATREYRVTPGSVPKFLRNGEEGTATEADLAWIAGMVREFGWRTGFDAERRATIIGERGGTAALLAEAQRVGTADGRLPYLLKGFDQRLDVAALAGYIREASALLDRTDLKVEFLLGVPAETRSDPRILAEVYAAASSTHDDAGIERILAGFPPQRPVSGTVWAQLELLIGKLTTRDRQMQLVADYRSQTP